MFLGKSCDSENMTSIVLKHQNKGSLSKYKNTKYACEVDVTFDLQNGIRSCWSPSGCLELTELKSEDWIQISEGYGENVSREQNPVVFVFSDGKLHGHRSEAPDRALKVTRKSTYPYFL